MYGDKGLTIATVILSVVGFIFLTPSLWATVTINGVATNALPSAYRIITIILVLAPVLFMILNTTGKLVLGRPKVVV